MKKCRSCGTERSLTDFSKNKNSQDGLQHWCKQCMNERKLIREYGITQDQYNILLEVQNSKCKLCGKTDSGRKDKGRLVVDHDHITGKVRGLLCHPCNVSLGLMNDNPELLERAAQYLRASQNRFQIFSSGNLVSA
jgi:hypothetical protein